MICADGTRKEEHKNRQEAYVHAYGKPSKHSQVLVAHVGQKISRP